MSGLDKQHDNKSNRGLDRPVDNYRPNEQVNESAKAASTGGGSVPVCEICGRDSHDGSKCHACQSAIWHGYRMDVDNISGSVALVSSYWAKPIPDRSNDWHVFVNGCEEGTVGFGPTEEEAIVDFLNNWFAKYGVNPSILSLKRS